MILIKEFEFDAAHKLLNYQGICKKLHGHTYKLVVKIQGTPDSRGIIIDFAELDKIVRKNVICILDHSYLNDIIKEPTAENIAIWVWNKLVKKLKTPNSKLFEIEIWETKSSGVLYKGEKHRITEK